MKQIRICQHIKTNGVRCGSPALRERAFCFYHYETRRYRFGVYIPPLEDADAIQAALTDLARAVADTTYDLKRASLLAYILQTASANARHILIDAPGFRDRIVRDLTPAITEENVPVPSAPNRRPPIAPRDPEIAAAQAEQRAAQHVLDVAAATCDAPLAPTAPTGS